MIFTEVTAALITKLRSSDSMDWMFLVCYFSVTEEMQARKIN